MIHGIPGNRFVGLNFFLSENIYWQYIADYKHKKIKTYKLNSIMRIKEGFVLREIAGEKIVSGEGINQINFNKMMTLNPTAAYLWENILDKEFDNEMLATLLVEKYDVDYDTALKDAIALSQKWIQAEIVCE